ncbi:tRNA dimethylallyltransferase [Clostridia bacterium]|nr:tRNA dimethylallyltransferase [Clostridia bacterium]
MKPPLIILSGPTAVGKTALSIKLAQKINGAIISADSMQIYRHMDIGSAKITTEEMQGIPHYLIDELEPTDEFNVFRFQQMAKTYIEQIRQAGKIPILTGGTGFYLQSILYDIDFTKEETDSIYRKELTDLAKEQGSGVLHKMLQMVDPIAAEQIHENNEKRLIRALEFHHLSGEKISAHNEKESQKESPYAFSYFVLSMERSILYERINRRADQMMAQGLLGEVQTLKNMGLNCGMTSMQGLGYKELLDYLDGLCSLEEAVFRIKRDTRHFAKRQLTWFRREKEVIWLNKEAFGNEEEMLRFMEEQIRVRIGEG